MNLPAALLLAVAILAAPPAPAEPTRAFLGGQSLVDLCADGAGGASLDYTQCVAYLSGLLDADTVIAARAGAPPRGICRPEGLLTVEELRRVFLRYALARPEDLANAASVVALAAFSAAWPCE